ncbi:hypothetical protein SKAU_G00215710 [Synaphobranchus kaupii]|uniref:Uncharacterized protein n=1 Tax=Synaphobranchus kaupii TaxID=118154 RepID=A0A9Q1IV08_SYNKA|nr:hypothetical protein SKAU_G00215710 [Synaphobranchus kaupii]
MGPEDSASSDVPKQSHDAFRIPRDSAKIAIFAKRLMGTWIPLITMQATPPSLPPTPWDSASYSSSCSFTTTPPPPFPKCDRASGESASTVAGPRHGVFQRAAPCSLW